MSDQNLKASAAVSALQAGLDSPAAWQSVFDQAIFLSGWVYAPGRDPSSCRVQAWLDDSCFAETRILSHRSDVSAKLGLPHTGPTGFRMLGRIPQEIRESREATLRIRTTWHDEPPQTVVEQTVRLVPALLRQRPHGEIVHPANDTLLHRENIYGSGPPLEDPGTEAANLICEYLPGGSLVVDVGCGAGAYGPGLIAAGHDWLGLETNDHCCEILQRRQLPFRRVDLESRALPCGDGEWENAICIEVLEHVDAPDTFVSEISRIIRGRALFSVPNIEVLPYLHGWAVVPWHMLEADHKNFFTRASLRTLLARRFRRVEVFSYGEHPLRTPEGIAVQAHLFAVADK